MKSVTIPDLMRKLPLDHRGYPIPFIVLRDDTGRPHFTINDTRKVAYTLKHDLCGICGEKLHRGRWMVGGPMSAFHPDGTYIDGPLHADCMRYAMQACPYLGAPNYSKRIDDATLKKENATSISALVNQTMIPDRPKLFVAVMTLQIEIYPSMAGTFYLKPKRPYRQVEFWRSGQIVCHEEAVLIVREVLDAPIPELNAPTIAVL
jgi:hypothetical protein